jgi:hypothetical protein
MRRLKLTADVQGPLGTAETGEYRDDWAALDPGYAGVLVQCRLAEWEEVGEGELTPGLPSLGAPDVKLPPPGDGPPVKGLSESTTETPAKRARG